MSFSEIFQWFIGILIGLSSVLTVILPVGGVQRLTGNVTDELPTVAEDFAPAIRIVLFTDTHNQNHHVADAIDTAYELFDSDADYAGVDGFFCLGDISSVGQEGDYERYAETLREHVRPETPMITIHGNHEFKDDNYREYFLRHIGHDPNTVTEINGFSCIAFSGERGATEWTYTPKSLRWLSSEIKTAEEKADGKPIFVFQHPHPWGTVYGSTVWGNPQLNFVLYKHTSVVDFSGHSHFPMNDPRSINQNTYTSVGIGAMATFELDKDYLPGQHPDGYDPAAEICVVEADNDGSVRIRGYDLLSDTYFCDYYIENVNDRDSFAYTYRNMKAHDSAPVFPEDTSATAYRNENGEWVISFDEAKSNYIVHEYRVKIKDEKGRLIFNENFVDDYFVIDDDDTADFRIGTDTLESGRTYTLIVRAESAYHLYSDPLELTFTAA
ncbi:MAG: metallophosphoesterase [Clostridia bacterium]|nr:metallophosphoesterase [Clostridia bacterium]MBR5426831.1 metallophosphoesterase [Clostridia bacterium]